MCTVVNTDKAVYLKESLTEAVSIHTRIHLTEEICVRMGFLMDLPVHCVMSIWMMPNHYRNMDPKTNNNSTPNPNPTHLTDPNRNPICPNNPTIKH